MYITQDIKLFKFAFPKLVRERKSFKFAFQIRTVQSIQFTCYFPRKSDAPKIYFQHFAVITNTQIYSPQVAWDPQRTLFTLRELK